MAGVLAGRQQLRLSYFVMLVLRAFFKSARQNGRRLPATSSFLFYTIGYWLISFARFF
jgi:hypothetical protein